MSLDEKFTKNRFNGRVAIVTGGASGIGYATVERFLNDGASVAIFDINEVEGAKAQERLYGTGWLPSSVMYFKVDVSDEENVQAAVKKVIDHFGKLNFLINCAAFFKSDHSRALKSAVDLTGEEFSKSMNINVKGSFLTVKACFPHMKAESKKFPGTCSIINISSGAGYHPDGSSTWAYCTGKAAILNLTRCMARDFGVDGIIVNTVSPAYTRTPPILKVLMTESDVDKKEQEWSKRHCLRRMGNPNEQAAVIAFLCSSDASFMTGADVAVDGGYLCLGPEPLPE